MVLAPCCPVPRDGKAPSHLRLLGNGTSEHSHVDLLAMSFDWALDYVNLSATASLLLRRLTQSCCMRSRSRLTGSDRSLIDIAATIPIAAAISDETASVYQTDVLD